MEYDILVALCIEANVVQQLTISQIPFKKGRQYAFLNIHTNIHTYRSLTSFLTNIQALRDTQMATDLGHKHTW